jgi:hypothetical protein
MQADVVFGVTIAEFVPVYGAALVILCCLWMDTALLARNYGLIFDSYSCRVLRWNQRATICALTRIPHYGITYPYHALCHLYIGVSQFMVQDAGAVLQLLGPGDVFAGVCSISIPASRWTDATTASTAPYQKECLRATWPPLQVIEFMPVGARLRSALPHNKKDQYK